MLFLIGIPSTNLLYFQWEQKDYETVAGSAMITHTTAIVFKSVDYSESSKIVTMFTREHGKIALMVKGAKKPKNKFSGLIETGNLLDVIYYYKASRGVQILTEASLQEQTLNLRTDFEKMAMATSAMELISQLLHEGEVNKPLFDFSQKLLVWLNTTDIPPRKIFPYVQIRLADLMGLGLRVADLENAGGKTNYLSLDSGLISTEGASAYSYKLTQNQFEFVRMALQTRSSQLFKVPFETGELKNLVEHLDRYLKYHVEGLRDRKSDAIFEQILQE